MRDIYKIENLKEKIREEIVLAMRRSVDSFKEYVKTEDEHENYPKQVAVEGEYIQTNYGCEKDNYYYCFIPGYVRFIYDNSQWRSNCIFFNDKFKCWFVYDIDRKEYVAFEALDTDSQIAFFRMLDNLLFSPTWSWYR